VASCPHGVSQSVTGGVAFRRVGIEAIGPWVDTAKIYEVSDKAGEHFGVLNDSIVIADVCEFALHVKRHFGDTRFDSERGVPSASARTVESVQAAGEPI
jgi:hypothetical protein